MAGRDGVRFAPLRAGRGISQPLLACPWSARSDGDRRGIRVAHGHITMPLTCILPGQRHRFDDLLSSWSQVRSLPGALGISAGRRGFSPLS